MTILPLFKVTSTCHAIFSETNFLELRISEIYY